jgi:anti-sigma factor RsiW
MNAGHQFCADKALLMSYLYGECDEVERRGVEQHLTDCSACAAEIDQLRAVRVSLSEWKVTDRAPGVRLPLPDIAETVPEQTVATRSWTPPWWLQTAAAILLLAASAGLARVEVQYGSDGFVVRTGWRTPAAAQPAPSVQVPVATEQPWRQELAALERDLRSELRAARPTAVPAPTASQNIGADRTEAGARGLNEATLLQRVQALIEQSEDRQRRELAERLSGIVTEVEMQRRADLRGVQQRFGQLEGQTGIVVRQNQEVVNYLRRVSQQP